MSVIVLHPVQLTSVFFLFYHIFSLVTTPSNAVSAEISGNKGERKAFATLQRLKSQHTILQNVELTADACRSEIDAAVITPKGVFIVEVKNTAKDVFIDEDGNYYRMGEYQRLDCNIAEKMNIKEILLRKALGAAGFEDVNIFGIVVFTDNRIEVRNRHTAVKSCFLGQLPYFIDEQEGNAIYDDEVRTKMADAIEQARCHECYQVKLNVSQFKEDFADLISQLELASSKKEEADLTYTETALDENVPTRKVHTNVLKKLNRFFSSESVKNAGTVAASVAIVAVSAVTIFKNH